MLKRKGDAGSPPDEMEDEEKQSDSSGDGGDGGGSSQPALKKQRADTATDKPAGSCTHAVTSERSSVPG